jgi:hypothetical protein
MGRTFPIQRRFLIDDDHNELNKYNANILIALLQCHSVYTVNKIPTLVNVSCRRVKSQ